jgi:hypothetical protein
MKRLLLVLPVAVAVLATPAQGATLLRLNGIGPLKLGMSTMASLDTGWLSDRQTGCKLGGPPYPVTYRLDGSAAPAAIVGSVELNRGKLTNVIADSGVRTATGVVPGKTTWASMVTRYRNAGYKVSARYDDVFQVTFVHVKTKGGKAVMTGIAQKKIVDTIGVPFIPLCE